jgi:hypothetical protein
MMFLAKSSTMRCLLKKPPMLRIYPLASFLQENKTAFKASKKIKKVVEDSSSQEEDDDYSDEESTGYDPNEMDLFIRRFSKMMSKKKFIKGDKKDKFRTKTKGACYSCDKCDHYIANCAHVPRDEGEEL